MNRPPRTALNWIDPRSARACYSALLLALLSVGCSTSKDQLLPHGDQNMLDIWNSASGSSQRLQEARLQLRRPVDHPPLAMAYTRTAANEIHNLFPRLPNPDLLLYVYPHLSGELQAPVPGYTTVLPFYQKTHYALPGERQEDL